MSNNGTDLRIHTRFIKDPESEGSQPEIYLAVTAQYDGKAWELWKVAKEFERELRGLYTFSLVGKKPVGLHHRLGVGPRTVLFRVIDTEFVWLVAEFQQFLKSNPPVKPRLCFDPWQWPYQLGCQDAMSAPKWLTPVHVRVP